MLERYFRHVLKKRGFEDVDRVYWSLGYCQGDGCSFTASLSVDDLPALVEHIFPTNVSKAPVRVKNLIRRRCIVEYAKDNDYSVKIEQTDSHYVHANTMTADYSVDWGDLSDFGDDSPQELTDTILEYAKDVANDLESIGYQLIEAVNREEKEVWRFRTENYLFRLTEIEEEIDTTYLSDWDEDCFIATCESMLKGESRITALKAEAWYLPDADEQWYEYHEPDASAVIGCLEIAADDKHYAGYRRELISELIHEIKARHTQPISEAA